MGPVLDRECRTTGGFHAGDRYRRINGSGDKDGNYGFYAMGQQMVWREGGFGSAEGLTPWLAVAYQPQQSINLTVTD